MQYRYFIIKLSVISPFPFFSILKLSCKCSSKLPPFSSKLLLFDIFNSNLLKRSSPSFESPFPLLLFIIGGLVLRTRRFNSSFLFALLFLKLGIDPEPIILLPILEKPDKLTTLGSRIFLLLSIFFWYCLVVNVLLLLLLLELIFGLFLLLDLLLLPELV